MGLLPLTYRRPQHVDQEKNRRSVSSDNHSENENASLDSEESGASAGVPEALTFDKIISGGTCPPMTIRDFMNYLIYIEHSAENLQFFLWYRDYVKRFDEAHTSDKPLAPEWTQAMAEETLAKIKKDAAEKRKTDPLAAELFKGTDFEGQGGETIPEGRDPFHTPPRTPGSDDQSTLYSSSHAPTYRSQAHDTFAAVGAKQPFTIQPFRAEVDRVIATYLAADAPRQLNLSNHEHKVTMHALAYTTHPSAFRLIARTTENTLRKQAHPNFVRWSICNGNPARVFFARGLGVGTILLATAGAIVLTLSRAGRGYRALFAIGWVLGIATLIAAYKGMCVVLHGLHHRHIRPWELFAGEDDHHHDEHSLPKGSFDSLGSSNSYEDEPWVVRYEKRNVVRKVFDRELWIQEPALRSIQDTIFVQAMGSALVLSAILTAIFVAVPGGHLF
ncbi:hypothetical protein PFICI_02298 [Pestalotiopsis fici W106-1]|uniref:RGS domain-containing protein n=1 Tax=Pestalotiopsis fici (strain W106-1 / CGMCC3.15140) TaxID=1229662 RepID=W3XDW6_PESFW|nr:uncharacterized protein PFICI_02298 [Pestalotiopsis fici W106-1]ETS84273.1 hypothetical protein PFICI_02298 [Pestalotiopsis fici W106-1]